MILVPIVCFLLLICTSIGCFSNDTKKSIACFIVASELAATNIFCLTPLVQNAAISAFSTFIILSLAQIAAALLLKRINLNVAALYILMSVFYTLLAFECWMGYYLLYDYCSTLSTSALLMITALALNFDDFILNYVSSFAMSDIICRDNNDCKSGS